MTCFAAALRFLWMGQCSQKLCLSRQQRIMEMNTLIGCWCRSGGRPGYIQEDHTPCEGSGYVTCSRRCDAGKVRCLICGGSGVWSKPFTCEKCAGTGSIIGDDGYPTTHSTCGGSGTVFGDEVCSPTVDCDGCKGKGVEPCQGCNGGKNWVKHSICDDDGNLLP